MKLRMMVCVWLVHALGILVWASLESTGLAKPIADLRDYNGTYTGAVGTGTVGYNGGTLYRDNQDGGYVAGCLGEGCGSHPGVDIPIRSGSRVYAAQSGTVVINRCDTQWGGLVVIKSSHPWQAGAFVYYVYAHLRKRVYANGTVVRVGDVVGTGAVLGESGGGIGDVCSGRSSGAHLHFQIDKDDGNAEPYYPTLSGVNTRDTFYSVANRTYNPVTFVTGGYRWGFAETGNRELWELFDFSTWGVTNHALWLDGGWDLHVQRGGDIRCGLAKPCGAGVLVEANEYKQLYVESYNYCPASYGKVYFTTATENFWDEAKSVDYFANSGFQRVHVIMNSNPKWSGFITGVRLDPATTCNPYVSDPVYLGELTLER